MSRISISLPVPISLVAAAMLLALALAATPAVAQQMQFCAPRDTIIQKLTSQFKETRRSYGLQQSSGVYEVFASEAGTWTITMTSPSGMTCVLAVGEAWRDEKAAQLIEGDPA